MRILFLSMILAPLAAIAAASPNPARIPLPSASSKTTTSPATVSDTPMGNFDPAAFGKITSGSLPMENGTPIAIRVNGRPVTWEEFNLQTRMLSPKVFHQYAGRESNVYATLATVAIQPMVINELYRQYADQHHLTVHPTEIEKSINDLKASREPGGQLLLSQLNDHQVKELAMISLVRSKVDKYLGDEATSTPPTQKEIEDFISSTAPTTHTMEVVRARHIVVRATPDMSEFNRNDARARIDEILEKLKSGRDFFQMARQSSQDRFTAYRGGDLGYFEPSTMFEAFATALKTMKPGDISEVVQTPVGYHIIQLTERHNDDLLLQLDKFRKRAAIDSWKTSAGDSAKIENYLEQSDRNQ